MLFWLVTVSSQIDEQIVEKIVKEMHYNPFFEPNQLLFLFLPLLKVNINQSLQLQKIFLHPFSMNILTGTSWNTLRAYLVQCLVL